MYRFDIQNKSALVQNAIGHHVCSNGPTWSLDGKKFYFTCSANNEIREYNYDVKTSLISGPVRTVLKMNEQVSESPSAVFDGGCIDSDGYLWWAVNGGYKVIRIDPSDGTIVMDVSLDYKAPTSLCFGGSDYRTLLVTSIGSLMPGTEDKPNGGVAMIKFKDDSIRGNPPDRCIEFEDEEKMDTIVYHQNQDSTYENLDTIA